MRIGIGELLIIVPLAVITIAIAVIIRRGKNRRR